MYAQYILGYFQIYLIHRFTTMQYAPILTFHSATFSIRVGNEDFKIFAIRKNHLRANHSTPQDTTHRGPYTQKTIHGGETSRMKPIGQTKT